MLRNYLKVAVRSIRKNKIYSVINIAGLAVSMACALLIFIFVKDEISYDRFHKDSDNIYRVVKDFVNDDGTRIPDATTPAALAPAMQKEFPEVVAATRVYPNWGRIYLIKYGDKILQEERLFRVDSSFFDVFTFSFIAGKAQDALKDSRSIILTESTAQKYFGTENPIGKILSVDQLGDMEVTGILKDVPANSHFHFDLLVSFKTLGNDLDASWGGYNYYTYVRTKTGINQAGFVAKIQDLYKRSINETNIFWVQPITDIHLTSNLKWELEPNSNKLYVYIFTLIGIFIILIAAINYINLATAKASGRAKEIGVRKVAGALKKTLIFQFLVESIITCLISLILAVTIAYLLLPVINNITVKQLSLLDNPLFLLYVFLGAMILGAIAGLFPALYLSSFKPVSVLKGLKLNEKGALSLRKALVVVQFTISVVLITGVIIVSQQMEYIRSSNLGLNPDQVMVINKSFNIANKQAFYNELVKNPGVREIAYSGGMVGELNSTSRLHARGSNNAQVVNYLNVGDGYLDVLDISIKEGRGFSSNFPGDTINTGGNNSLERTIGGIILNETAVKDLAISSPVIGKQIIWSMRGDTTYYLNIVGIAKDFHFTSMHNRIKPFAFINAPQWQNGFTIKLSAEGTTNVIAQLEDKWNAIYPDKPFQYSFLDETFAKQYQSETRFQKIFYGLVILGIGIACLGLFGLITFAAEQRIKEIGIRKVLGASVVQASALLSKDFLKLVLLSIVIAAPIAWWIMSKWLENYVYRIEIQWWMFALAGVMAIIIAMITVSFQAVKAALANPVESLRAE